MVRVFVRTVSATITIALLSTTALAGTGFILQRTEPVPGLHGEIGTVKFADIDRDGLPELMAQCSSTVVLYSISSGRTLFSKTLDLGYTFGSMELDDVNRDSVVDVAIASSYVRKFGYYYDEMTYRLDVYDGASSFTYHDSVLYASTSLWLRRSPPLVVSSDLNGDGLNELLFSFDSGSVSNPIAWWYYYYAYGKSLSYYSFPSLVTGTSNRRFLSLRSMPLSTGGTVPIAQAVYSSWSDAIYHLDYSFTTVSIVALGSALTSSTIATQDTSLLCGARYRDDDINRDNCVGRIFPDSSSSELLTTWSHDFSCPEESISTREMRLNLWEFSSHTSAQLLWSCDIKGSSYYGFVFIPNFPGRFFAFLGDSLLMFDGKDGAVLGTLSPVPQGAKHWDSSFPDKEPRLISIHDTTIDIYRFEAAVDAPETTFEPPGPRSFALNQNYPNPFNLSTKISFALPTASDYTLTIYNVMGQVVKEFAGYVPAGAVSVTWDATGLSSGVYFYRLRAGEFTVARKMLLLK